MVKFKMHFLKKSKCILKKERENKIKEGEEDKEPSSWNRIHRQIHRLLWKIPSSLVTPDLLNDKSGVTWKSTVCSWRECEMGRHVWWQFVNCANISCRGFIWNHCFGLTLLRAYTAPSLHSLLPSLGSHRVGHDWSVQQQPLEQQKNTELSLS